MHPDTLAQRQLDRTPEPKLLPSESRAYREQGQISPRMQEVLDIRQARAATGDRRNRRRRGTYWEGRKGELGITAAQPMAHKLYAIREARAQRRDHPPEPASGGP